MGQRSVAQRWTLAIASGSLTIVGLGPASTVAAPTASVAGAADAHPAVRVVEAGSSDLRLRPGRVSFENTVGKYTCRLRIGTHKLWHKCRVTDRLADGYGVHVRMKAYYDQGEESHWNKRTDDVGPAGTSYQFPWKRWALREPYTAFRWGFRLCQNVPDASDRCFRVKFRNP